MLGAGGAWLPTPPPGGIAPRSPARRQSGAPGAVLAGLGVQLKRRTVAGVATAQAVAMTVLGILNPASIGVARTSHSAACVERAWPPLPTAPSGRSTADVLPVVATAEHSQLAILASRDMPDEARLVHVSPLPV